MTVEERLALIEERHANLAFTMDVLAKSMVRLEEKTEKTDVRINRLVDVSLKIGADLAERLRALEDKN